MRSPEANWDFWRVRYTTTTSQRHVRACNNTDPEYGRMLAEALGISLEEALVAEDPAHPEWDKRDCAKR